MLDHTVLQCVLDWGGYLLDHTVLQCVLDWGDTSMVHRGMAGNEQCFDLLLFLQRDHGEQGKSSSLFYFSLEQQSWAVQLDRTN